MYKRIRLLFKRNRDHIAYDILSEFKKLDLGIIWMEIYTRDCYVKFEVDSDEMYNVIMTNLKEIKDLESISEVDLISFEARNIQINEIVNLLGKLVLVVDCNGIIKYSNITSDLKIVKGQMSDITGRPISEIIDDKEFVLDVVNCDKDYAIKELQIGGGNYLVKMYNKKFRDSDARGKIIVFDDITEFSNFTDKIHYSSHITFKDLIYESPIMERTVKTAMEFSQMDVEILITGESGTGKELFTRAIHNMSSRRENPFIAINCSSLPEQLLESELFGYEDGSFTGAVKGGKAGIFENCKGGTIFLDEIGDMPIHLQAKLLRVLQEKRIRRIGGSKEIPVNFRLISATNKDLKEKILEKEFRLDLFYRLNTLTLQIPPLRDRKEDIRPLVTYFTKKYLPNRDGEIVYTDATINSLLNYKFPGNVRELQNVIIRALTTLKDSQVKPQDLKFYFEEEDEVVGENFDQKIENYEKKLILEELEKGGSIRNTAKELGITHTKLINRMKKYNIKKYEE